MRLRGHRASRLRPPARAVGAALLLLLPAAPVLAAPDLASPTNLTVVDEPNDSGHGLRIRWTLSAADDSLLAYEIQRGPDAAAPDSAWLDVGTAPRGTDTFTYSDDKPSLQGKPNPAFVPSGRPVFVRVRGVGAAGVTAWTPAVPGVARGNWFHKGKVNILVAVLGFGTAVVWLVRSARQGRKLYIRPIPGLSAVDEAIGRATEMGRPILYILGLGTAGEIATIAGYTILSRVARRTAEYQTKILVPVNDPVMMTMAQEVVREAYTQAGRPEVYRPENVQYISAMQFPYVAAVTGLMMREKTATNFYMGVFHAESLLLAEAGSVTGSIQISGTDQVAQIPFFVAATDYTLIGEELYAASAYLSQDPILLGPLKAQDYTKVILIAIVILGVAALTAFHWDGVVKLVQSSV